MKDMRGVEIQEGDVVAYGKSSRYHPINIGKVISISEDTIEILGSGNSKAGKIPAFNAARLIVLPDEYIEDIK